MLTPQKPPSAWTSRLWLLGLIASIVMTISLLDAVLAPLTGRPYDGGKELLLEALQAGIIYWLTWSLRQEYRPKLGIDGQVRSTNHARAIGLLVLIILITMRPAWQLLG